ncbi:RagB/SusD family nutrient uptake outer membrane protein [Porphyromonas levii]|uniref:RagB/SusD family nutrient uptake outer membrane protein n=1 Tax=Porphyromonas levii TaxID=28114 RepID=A0A4Y8WR98_9PORP|nr:RagB/SusD family nutrient uptake outer membrane protein [Porphyromonas levii]MBR8730112.1 hypothetical protein [Porphyromonas levii]MBR8762893.1 hypothetical protein [Porphyromonas levii]MBR8764842.1 hypothetical protein [Porphyromonas levii]MBR8768998.1 hypothetical protein [Porphyromonas levii]MBR8773388.1 hypothetical protein [Porphyromonas levii]
MPIKKIFILLIVTIALSSCQKFLSQSPDSSLDVDIDSEEKIAELLAGAYPDASYFAFLEARTDNVSERVHGSHTRLNEAMYFWEDYDHEDLDTPLNYWNACYRGIAQANKALELLAKYPKSDRVKALYGEAFLLRAYLHFMLVNIWSEPYSPGKSKTALGIPYSIQPEKHALVTYNRGTVAEVYAHIEQDLKRGISLVNDQYYQHPKFHFNKKAAYAFASRFYLMKGEWKTVVAYANYVLGYDPGQVLRSWKGYAEKLSNDRGRLYRLYTSTEEPANLLMTATESRWARSIATDKYGITTHGMRYIFDKKGIESCNSAKNLNMYQSYLFRHSTAPISDGQYVAKFDELSIYGHEGSKPRGLYVTNVLLTTDEVMLNRMEAYAMLGEYERSIDDLLVYLRSKFGIDLTCGRTDYTWTDSKNYDIYTPFYGMTIKQLALIKIITDFRQKEFVHEGMRWFDIRRFYMPVKRDSKSALYRPLLKEDPRKLLQIPVEAINRGLEPNIR